MSVVATLEPMMIQALKNGMTFKQIRARIPGLAARKLNITEAQFHAQLGDEFGPSDDVINELIARILVNFTPSEQRAIALRK